jgi:hypothetical protein
MSKQHDDVKEATNRELVLSGTIGAAIAAVVLYFFWRTGGVDVVLQILPQKADYPDAQYGTLEWHRAMVWWFLTVIFYAEWLGIGVMIAAISAGAYWNVLYDTVIGPPLEALNEYGVPTRWGRLTLADVAIVLALGSLVGTWIWYARPFGPIESFLRGTLLVITIPLIVVMWVKFFSTIEVALEKEFSDGDRP